MILTIGGIKGGSGKTTIATNLSVMFANSGFDVLLVDADDQSTASDFVACRNEFNNDKKGFTSIQLHGANVRTQVLKLADKYEHIVIDTGGRDTTSQRAALSVSDVYLIPFLPQSFDIWTLGRVTELIEEILSINPTLKAFGFLSRAFPVGVDNAQAAEMISECESLTFIDAPLVSRKAYSNAASQGMAVVEWKPANRKAIAEINALYNFIEKLL
jgi:chromosome partitioning protein